MALMPDYCTHINLALETQCVLDRDHAGHHQYSDNRGKCTAKYQYNPGDYYRCELTKGHEGSHRDGPSGWEEAVLITEEALKDQPNVVQQIQNGRLNEYRSGPQGAAVTDDGSVGGPLWVVGLFANLPLPVRMRAAAEVLEEATERRRNHRNYWTGTTLRENAATWEREDAQAAGKEQAVEELARDLIQVEPPEDRLVIARRLIDAGWTKVATVTDDEAWPANSPYEHRL